MYGYDNSHATAAGAHKGDGIDVLLFRPCVTTHRGLCCQVTLGTHDGVMKGEGLSCCALSRNLTLLYYVLPHNHAKLQCRTGHGRGDYTTVCFEGTS